ncbi:MAG TPA: CDP-alcohol phosphatidyltransferase family protein [Gemmatimonadaceae bacterium]|nr:CDP-alcohol phosphatidyltransferase family protein [Gemmatimonadaceae bacterium]
MNLPNAITLGRIACAPLLLWLPLIDSWALRLLAFVLFVVAAVTDYIDGFLARSRNLITDLGRLLDPAADKLLLVATLVPMYILMAPRDDRFAWLVPPVADAFDFPFVTPVGTVPLPWWVLAIVIGRELFMTIFRQAASRRGVVISAIGPAKWKTALQSVWVGSAYFWFFLDSLAARRLTPSSFLEHFALFNGIVGSVTMTAAVVLTLYSLGIYLRRYRSVFTGRVTEQRSSR